MFTSPVESLHITINVKRITYMDCDNICVIEIDWGRWYKLGIGSTGMCGFRVVIYDKRVKWINCSSSPHLGEHVKCLQADSSQVWPHWFLIPYIGRVERWTPLVPY